MNFRRMDKASFGIIGLTAALTAVVYDRLPVLVPAGYSLVLARRQGEGS